MSSVPGIHVFLAAPEVLLPGQDGPDVWRFLDEQDRSHIARFRFPRDRDIATASRLLQRFAVAYCARISWESLCDIRFSSEPGVRPAILAPDQALGVSFSAANTRGMVACAVSGSSLVGMDVEQVQETLAPELVGHCCTAEESAELLALPLEDRRRAFFQLWALKESYLKARGIGLGLSPHLIGFGKTERHDCPALLTDAVTEPYPDHWHFRVLDTDSNHAAALCVRSPSAPAEIHVWRPHWVDGILSSVKSSELA